MRNALPPLKPLTSLRYLASWGIEKPPLDRKEVELRVIKSVSSHDKVDQSQVDLSTFHLPRFSKISNPWQVKLETHLINDLGLDSLDQVEVIMAVEDEFNIDIDDVASEKLFTVKDIVEFVIKNEKPDPRQNPGYKLDSKIDFGQG